MQDRGFNSFASHMMKLSVRGTEWRSPIRESTLLTRYGGANILIRLQIIRILFQAK